MRTSGTWQSSLWCVATGGVELEPTWHTKSGGRFRAYGKFASWSRIIRRISSGRMPSRGSRGKRSSQVVSKTVANYGAYSHLSQSLSHKVVWWDKSALSRLALTDRRYKRSFRVVPGVRATRRAAATHTHCQPASYVLPTTRPIDLSSSGSADQPGPIVFSEGSARFKRGNE